MSDAGSGLEREFEPRGVRRGGVLFLDADRAIELLREASRRGVRALGVETVRLTRAETRPDMYGVLDLTVGSRGGEPSDWDDAIHFVDECRGPGFHLEVTLRGRVQIS